MKIQLALDLLDEKEALSILSEVGEEVDIIEIGTSLVKISGIDFTIKVKELFPDKEIFFDLKTIDGPEREGEIVKRTGAQRCSMLGFATEYSAKKFFKKIDGKSLITVDLQSINDPVAAAQRFSKLGFTSFCVHRTEGDLKDIQENIEEFKKIRTVTSAEMMIAGGINLSNVKDIVSNFKPDILVIGGAITKAENPKDVLEKVKSIINDV